MRIEHLFLENFGIHRSRRLVFGEGLQVVFGPNESGKTTLLAALRQTLFGMPHISAYAFDGSPATKARVQLANGRHVELARKKTRGPGLSGEFEDTREPLTVEVWERCLTGATAGLFENLFAISLQELSNGEASLREAGLAESLFGIAMGGMTRFRQLDDRLREQSEQLFSPNSRASKPRINSLIRDIQTAEREYEQARFSARDYGGLREEIEEHESLAQRLREDWDEMRRRDRRLERIEAALPIWRKAEQLRTELHALGGVANVPLATLASLREQARKLQDVVVELTRWEHRFSHPIDSQTLPAGELVPHEPLIRSLADRVAGVRNALTERDQLVATLTDLELRIHRDLSSIQPGWTADDLSRAAASLAQRETVQLLSEEAARLIQAAQQLQQRRAEWEVERDRLQAELQELPTTELLPGCQELLTRGQLYEREVERSQQIASQRAQLERQIRPQAQQLSSQVEISASDLNAVVLPLSATIESFITKTDQLDRAIDQARSRTHDAEERFARAVSDLAKFDSEHEDCDRAAVIQLREERERGWMLIAGQLRGQPDRDAIQAWTKGQPEKLFDQYRESVVAADLMADKLLADAAHLAQRQHLVAQVERCETEVADLTAASDLLSQQGTELQSQWRAQWPAEPFCPRSPREMAEWRKQCENWFQVSEQLTLLASEQQQCHARMSEFESDLRRAFPVALTARDSLGAARDLEKRLLHAEQSRPRLEHELRTVRTRLDALERDQFEHSLAQADLDARKTQLLSEMGLPGNWNVAVASRVVARLSEIQSLDQERSTTHVRLQQLNEQCTSFMAQAERLHELLQVRWDGPQIACDQVIAWRSQLDQRRELELEQSRLLAERSSSEQMLHRLREQRDSLQSQIDALRKPWPELVAFPLEVVLSSAEQAENLRAELRDLDHQWQAQSDGDPTFADHLRGSTIDQVREERARLRTLLQERDEERARELASAESLRQKLKARADETKPLELGQKVESLRAKLSDAIDEWAPLTLARHLMEQARVRFEKNQQPQLLVDAGEIFQQLTLGEYVQLTRAVGQQTELLAVPRTGTAKLPKEMSTGTREQLYLAIRLAYLKQYARRAEPLPLVMDDVLVNFDEDRARQTLRVIHEFSQQYQILFLTCHRRMVELIRSIKPDLKPIELKPGSLERPTEESLPENPPLETKRPRGRPRKPDEPDHPVLFR